MTPVVRLYGRDGCHLCDDARRVLERIGADLEFDLIEVDIESDDDLLRVYMERIPVIELDGAVLYDFFVDEPDLRVRLEEAARM